VSIKKKTQSLVQPILDRGHTAVVFVRHGRTEYNHQRRFLGLLDLPLDDVGSTQAAELAAELSGQIDAVYSSPLARAIQTASPLGVPRILPGLAELDQGALEGMLGPEAMERYPDFFAAWATDPGSARVPGGETLLEGQERALAALDQVVGERDGPCTVAVVTHQLILAGMCCAIAGAPLTQWRSYCVRNAAITIVESGRGKLHLVETDMKGDRVT